MSELNLGGSLEDGLDNSGVREDVNKVTEEDRKRIQENSSQAKKVAQQIKKDKKINDNLANFLSYLIKNIKNENIISGLYNVFFIVKNPKTNISFRKKNINNIVVIGIFAPFYKKSIEELGIFPFFDGILDMDIEYNLNSYLKYIKELSNKHHDNVPVDKKTFLNFLFDIVLEYGLIDKNLEEKEYLEIKNNIEEKLY